MADDELLVHRAGGRLSLVLNRPRARNAVSPTMLDALVYEIDRARTDGTRVVTIAGTGDAFCAGADITSYAEPRGRRDELEEFTRRARDLCRAIETLDAVTVAAVDGPCLGGGFELALSCDLVIASDRARFGLPETRLGLIPGWGGTQRLTAAIGGPRARRLVLTAELIGAVEAVDWGIAATAVPPAQLGSELDRIADDLLARAPLALAAATRAIRGDARRRWPTEAAEHETRELLDLFETRDGAEGVAAFIAKRPPRFTGS
ncbi:enoyl-CoA hydratase/isomerase family protein [Homoserinibacter sp. GY 40078]|uniref:enoyl-CoA hydratase/isomerase family protein n=1 Tax=Homoserinibacter sp. GY 40078 TaxID=2603275 RepID=UPI0011C7C70B|nr:enoyl-CoA hydratase/isomerase family protein [Homoserinibacter sp. GY 40078]TXK18627.1 enoyl-CoA hydratase/isomerase family protein [Homoserinibacter sp. GY 40078]